MLKALDEPIAKKSMGRQYYCRPLVFWDVDFGQLQIV
jgi:hypothetical protein